MQLIGWNESNKLFTYVVRKLIKHASNKIGFESYEEHFL